MQRIKSAVGWYKKGYDSDSTGYFSSGSDRPLSRSQFILRPSTAPSSLTYATNCSSLDYEEYSPRPRWEAEPDGGYDDCYTETLDPFPFDEIDDDIEDIFDELEIEDVPTRSYVEDNLRESSEGMSTLNRKKIVIKEPDHSSRIYFDERLRKITNLPAKGSIPSRSILKKKPSLCHSHIYEEIEDDHLCPLPDDVRPLPPRRPDLLPIRIFPPCKSFKPNNYNNRRCTSIQRRKKKPSFHNTN